MVAYSYLPGPGIEPEMSSLDALRNSIATNSFAQLIRTGVWGVGETTTPPYYAGQWAYGAISSQRYLQHTWYGGGGTHFLRYRFSSVLLGTLDPAQWFPYLLSYIDENVALYSLGSYLRWTVEDLHQILDTSGLTSSPIDQAWLTALTYSYGPNLGKTWGYKAEGSYLSSPAEKVRVPPVRDYTWSYLLIANDADDGTINGVWGNASIGESVEYVPTVVAEPGTQTAAWDDLGTAVDGLGPVLNDGLDDLAAEMGYVSRAANIIRPDATTHPDDVGTPEDVAAPPSATGMSTFAAAGVLPVIYTAPTTMLYLSKPISIVIAGMSMLGGLAAAVWSSGIVPALSAMATTISGGGWITSLTNTANSLQNLDNKVGTPAAPEDGTLLEILERIAVALEAIQEEVVQDPENPATKPGIVLAVEWAAQAKSEVTLRSHGQLVTCSTGVIEEE